MIFYCSKITGIPKFGLHGDVSEGMWPSPMAQPHTVTHPCHPMHIPVPWHHSPPAPWAQGAAQDAQSTPQQSRGPGLASQGARTIIISGLVFISTAPAHFHGNAWGDMDVVPCYAMVPHMCVGPRVPGMLGPSRARCDAPAAAAEPGDVLMGSSERDG